MAYPDLNQILVAEENRIGEKIYRKSLNTSVWNTLVPKEAWPDGLSDSIQVMTVERNLPENIDTWSELAANEDSNNCIPTADVVPTGQTLRSFNLSQKALESPEICVNDTRNAFKTAEQIRMMYENLTKVVRYTWKRRAMLEYFRLAEHKIVAANGLPESSSHMPTLAATSMLTQGILNKVYTWLISDNAEDDGGSLGRADGAPQFVLITDMETSDSILREDATNNAFLWNAKRVPELLQPLGVERAFRGFYHVKDVLPRRFTFAGGVWTEVQPYETAAATKGTKAKLSPEYMAAPFTDSYVFLPSVFSFMVPQPISTKGSGTSWKAQSYMGDFKWLNIQDRVNNPDNSIGFYRALLQSGSKPVHPEFGFVIRHLRCPSDIGAQACPVSTAGASSDLDSGESFLV
jgi:hypothetical protein